MADRLPFSRAAPEFRSARDLGPLRSDIRSEHSCSGVRPTRPGRFPCHAASRKRSKYRSPTWMSRRPWRWSRRSPCPRPPARSSRPRGTAIPISAGPRPDLRGEPGAPTRRRARASPTSRTQPLALMPVEAIECTLDAVRAGGRGRRRPRPAVLRGDRPVGRATSARSLRGRGERARDARAAARAYANWFAAPRPDAHRPRAGQACSRPGATRSRCRSSSRPTSTGTRRKAPTR